jgi:hypothetical protein
VTTPGQDTEAGTAPVVHRRTVLKWLGVGAGSAVVACGIGVGARGAANGAFTAGAGAPYALWDEWASLTGVDRVVAAGVLACNPHNTQPWRIATSSRGGLDVVEVGSDPTRRMPVTDASHREHFAGLGCAVENMLVAAGRAGFAATVDVFPDGPASDLVARLVLRPTGGPGPDDALATAIPDRHTNRGPYTAQPVDPSALTALAAPVGGTGVRWVTGRREMDRLGELYVEATRRIVDDTAQSEEAFGWFRNDRADVERHRDGLTLDCQGLAPTTLFLAKVLPAQSRVDGDRFWVDTTRTVHTATAAAYGVVTVGDVLDRTAQVHGGRTLARLHLAATALGLGFHHMNQITERIDRDRATGAPDAFSARWSDVLGVPASTGLVSFRIGHPQRPGGLSPRRALADVRA